MISRFFPPALLILYNPRTVTRAESRRVMNQTTRKSLEQVAQECGRYPLEAFEFVRQGLSHTVEKIHGDTRHKSETECHVSGKQLSWGLRDYAVLRYGQLARTVLSHWGINRTGDFGRIVFAMVESKIMQKTDHDDLRDFEAVFDFEDAFRRPPRPATKPKAVFTL